MDRGWLGTFGAFAALELAALLGAALLYSAGSGGAGLGVYFLAVWVHTWRELRLLRAAPELRELAIRRARAAAAELRLAVGRGVWNFDDQALAADIGRALEDLDAALAERGRDGR